MNGFGGDSKKPHHMTPGAIDIEKMMAAAGTDVTTDDYDDVTDVGDAAQIRRQLDGLENMYSEVLKLLGLRKFGRGPGNGGPAGMMRGAGGRSKMYGSMSSLPSVSSIGSRPGFIFGHMARNPRFDDVTRCPGYLLGPSGFLPVATEGMSFL